MAGASRAQPFSRLFQSLQGSANRSARGANSPHGSLGARGGNRHGAGAQRCLVNDRMIVGSKRRGAAKI